eukprot:Em0001g1914a
MRHKMSGLTFFFVLAAMAAVGTLHVVSTAPTSEAVEMMSIILEELETQQNGCETLDSLIHGDINSLSQQCRKAMIGNAANVVEGAICTSACNVLYQAYIQCYGAAATQIIYKSLCVNGYPQGNEARQYLVF